jgi:pyocin large subunit-like protein
VPITRKKITKRPKHEIIDDDHEYDESIVSNNDDDSDEDTKELNEHEKILANKRNKMANYILYADQNMENAPIDINVSNNNTNGLFNSSLHGNIDTSYKQDESSFLLLFMICKKMIERIDTKKQALKKRQENI